MEKIAIANGSACGTLQTNVTFYIRLHYVTQVSEAKEGVVVNFAKHNHPTDERRRGRGWRWMWVAERTHIYFRGFVPGVGLWAEWFLFFSCGAIFTAIRPFQKKHNYEGLPPAVVRNKITQVRSAF